MGLSWKFYIEYDDPTSYSNKLPLGTTSTIIGMSWDMREITD